MEKYFEINYTIEDIQGMSHEEQLEYLEYLYDLRTEIMRQIDDKKSFYSEIRMSHRELMHKLLAGAKSNGYDSYAYHISDKSHKEVIIDYRNNFIQQ